MASWREALGLGWTMLIRLAFVIWIGTITVLAVIPHADDGIMVASNVTPSGMEKHIAGYFLATLLLYYGYEKKGARHTGGRAEDTPVEHPRREPQ